MSIRDPRSTPGILSAGLLVLAGAGVAGCGGSDVKTSGLEKPITAQFAASGVPLHDVSCKKGTKAKVGAKITCSGLNEAGTKLDIEGRVTAIKDKKASYRVVGLGGDAKGTQIAADALRVAQRRFGRAARTVTCPDPIRIPTSKPVVCALTKSGGKVYDATLTVDPRSRVAAQFAAKPR